MNNDFFLFEEKNITKDVLIIVFSGRQQGLANLNIFEFKNFLDKNFPDYDKCYCRDEKLSWYTKGITGISTDIKSTIEFFSSFNYKRNIMIGASMGGYAALLYGSILNIDTVIAFRPQTHLEIIKKQYDVENFDSDINNVLNESTKYYIYGDSSITDVEDIHSINYCNLLIIKENIKINRIDNFDIKEYKDKGFLLDDFLKII